MLLTLTKYIPPSAETLLQCDLQPWSRSQALNRRLLPHCFYGYHLRGARGPLESFLLEVVLPSGAGQQELVCRAKHR